MNAITRLACLFAFLIPPAGAYAQDTTFVTGNGAATGNCDITAPCRTLFQGVQAVESGGTVVVIGSGSFSPVTIDKSVTIDATGVTATIPAAGTGITINGTNIVVTLRNLDIDARQGASGIGFVHGATVIAEDVRIRNVTNVSAAGFLFAAPNGTLVLRNVSITNTENGTAAVRVDTSAGSQRSLSIENSLLSRNARGIVVQGNGSAQVSISNTTIANSTNHGIHIAATGGTQKFEISNSNIVNNGNAGLYFAPTGSATASAKIVRSEFDNNVIGIRADAAGSSKIRATLSDVSTSNNTTGIYATGNTAIDAIRATVANNSNAGVFMNSPALTRIGSSVVTGNGVGFAGPVSSYGNNQLLGNNTQGAKTPVAPGSVP